MVWRIKHLSHYFGIFQAGVAENGGDLWKKAANQPKQKGRILAAGVADADLAIPCFIPVTDDGAGKINFFLQRKGLLARQLLLAGCDESALRSLCHSALKTTKRRGSVPVRVQKLQKRALCQHCVFSLVLWSCAAALRASNMTLTMA